MESCIERRADTDAGLPPRFEFQVPSSELLIYARRDLVSADRKEDGPALMLEGSWPDESGSGRTSLDEAIDGRSLWIDAEASRLADVVCNRPVWRFCGEGPGEGVGLAWLNSLALRYHLIKLLRVVAYFETSWSAGKPRKVELRAARGKDEAYAGVLEEICRRQGVELRIVWHAASRQRPFPAAARWWRQVATAASRAGGTWRRARAKGPRVVFCGNPAVLEPLAGELAGRGAEIAWLYDRFAARSWLRWSWRGGEQLTCDSWAGRESRFVPGPPLGPIECHGCDLGGAVEQWLAACAATRGATHSRMLERIGRHFRKRLPDAVVTDEDATPLPRAAIAVARALGVPTRVVQHGAPYGRLGFAPQAADRILAWGESSRSQFERWDIPPERIEITGSPRHDALWQGRVQASPRREAMPANRTRIVLLATNPPADDRPDLVAFHLTSRSHREILRAVVSVVAGVPRAELIVKLHPRCRDVGVFEQVLVEFPDLTWRLVRYGGIEPWLAGAACVLSCASSAGIEAAAVGIPVIEILTAGTGPLLPPDDWGMLGAARNGEELRSLLTAALVGERPPEGSAERVFARFDRTASAQTADAVWRMCAGATWTAKRGG